MMPINKMSLEEIEKIIKETRDKKISLEISSKEQMDKIKKESDIQIKPLATQIKNIRKKLENTNSRIRRQTIEKKKDLDKSISQIYVRYFELKNDSIQAPKEQVSQSEQELPTENDR